jgi:hypothetical protein
MGKKNKEIVTLTGYNADAVEMLAKKSVTSGINDQKYYRRRLKFYRFFSLEFNVNRLRALLKILKIKEDLKKSSLLEKNRLLTDSSITEIIRLTC